MSQHPVTTEDFSDQLVDGLTPLRPLLGTWRTTGVVTGARGRTARLSGHDSWTVLPGGRWIAHQSATVTSGVPAFLHEIIGGSHPDGGWRMLVFDEGPMPELTQVRLETGPERVVVTVGGIGTVGRFTLATGEDAMTAVWQRVSSEEEWLPWLDLTYRRTVPTA